MAQETADGVPISDGFDYPVGPRDDNADAFRTHKVDTVLVDPAYFKSLGFWHPGEDWNGRGGGDTDFGDPIYAVSHGQVVDFGHYPVWGNIVLVEHALPDGSSLWSQYAHLDKISVNQVGQKVRRGQQIGTMGKGESNRYIAHLHFEIRKKKLRIDSWSPLVKDKNAVLANYHDPTSFIKANRPQIFAQRIAQAAPASTTSRATITPANQIIIDAPMTTAQANVGLFQRADSQNWFAAKGGYRNNMLWAPAAPQAGTNWAEWRPILSTAGDWHVWVFIPGENATTTYARYEITHAGGNTEVPINQAGNRNQWVDLGTYRFAPNQGHVRLTNATGEISQGRPPAVGYDAVAWIKAGSDADAAASAQAHSIRVLFEDGRVQTMSLEAYLRSVVPGEMPPSWPAEALKSQAITARGYAAYATFHPRHAPVADICTTTHCQHYDPSRIHANTDDAIRQTQGEVALYQGQVINTFFSARCGGHTRNNEDVWNGLPVPYLRGVPCPDTGAQSGHGVGFCQNGARVFAMQGRSYDQIVTHYYQGISLGQIPQG